VLCLPERMGYRRGRSVQAGVLSGAGAHAAPPLTASSGVLVRSINSFRHCGLVAECEVRMWGRAVSHAAALGRTAWTCFCSLPYERRVARCNLVRYSRSQRRHLAALDQWAVNDSPHRLSHHPKARTLARKSKSSVALPV
jgi:hypothetical protein